MTDDLVRELNKNIQAYRRDVRVEKLEKVTSDYDSPCTICKNASQNGYYIHVYYTPKQNDSYEIIQFICNQCLTDMLSLKNLTIAFTNNKNT